MLEYTDTNTGIKYNSISTQGYKPFPQPHYNGNNDWESIIEYGDPVKPFVNAVEIDWNGAQIGEGWLFKACSVVIEDLPL